MESHGYCDHAQPLLSKEVLTSAVAVVFHQLGDAEGRGITVLPRLPAGHGPGSLTKALCIQPMSHRSASTGFFSDAVGS